MMFGFRVTDFKVTDFKIIDVKMNDFKMIDFKAIDFKTPDFKMTDISCCCCCCWLLGADCWLLLMLLLPDAGCPRAAAGSQILLCFTYININKRNDPPTPLASSVLDQTSVSHAELLLRYRRLRTLDILSPLAP